MMKPSNNYQYYYFHMDWFSMGAHEYYSFTILSMGTGFQSTCTLLVDSTTIDEVLGDWEGAIS